MNSKNYFIILILVKVKNYKLIFFIIPFVILFLLYKNNNKINCSDITEDYNVSAVRESKYGMHVPFNKKYHITTNTQQTFLEIIEYKRINNKDFFSKEIKKLKKDRFKKGFYTCKYKSSNNILFISQGISNSNVLVIIPDYTFQAYNNLNEEHFYQEKVNLLSMKRPIEKFHYFHYPSYSPLKLLRDMNINYDLIKQSELVKSLNIDNLSKYKLLIIYGHDEYWSQNLFNHISTSVSSGTNLLNLSGNTAWWEIIKTQDLIKRKNVKNAN